MSILKLQLDKNRIYGLDIMRAMAILFVVVEHGGFLLPVPVSDFQRYFLLDGVSIFFVLSGFLIGGILIKTLEKESASFKTLLNFWKRRWIRTLPNYFLILSLLLIISLFTLIGAKPEGIYKYVFFIQNFNSSHPLFFPEAWSLSVEEWFYLLIPTATFILIAVTKLKSKHTILLVVLLTILFSIFVRYYRFTQITGTVDLDLLLRKQVITRLDSIIYGVLAAYIYYYVQPVWNKYKTPYFILGITILILQKTNYIHHIFGADLYDCVFSFSLNSIAIMLLLPLLNNLKTGNGFTYKFFTYISLISYSMYLLNLSFVQWWIIEKTTWFHLNGTLLMILKYVLYWAFTIIGSILLYKYYELPFMRLRDRITKKDSAPELKSNEI